MAHRLKNAGRSLAMRLSDLFDEPLPDPTPESEALISRFRADMEEVADAMPRGDGEITDRWRDYLDGLRTAARERDPREFLRWKECSPLLAGQSVFPHYLMLRLSRRWSSRWKHAMRAAPAGHPLPFFLNPRLSCNTVLFSYHLDQIERYTGRTVDELDVVVELGGGFGGMCRVVHESGFRGVYVIQDLPHLNALQSYYLESSGVPIVTPEEVAAAPGAAGAVLNADLDVLRRLVDDVEASGRRVGLFIANISLSECPIELREQLSEIVIARSDSILISYQEHFEGIDNARYFREWCARHDAGYEAEIARVPCTKVFHASYSYLKARRRATGESSSR